MGSYKDSGYYKAGQIGAGGIAGGAAAYSNNQASRKTLKEQAKNAALLQTEIGNVADQRIRDLASMYSPTYGSTEDMAQNAQAYRDLLEGTDYSQYDLTTPEAFQYTDEDGNPLTMEQLTEQSMNPMIQSIIDRASGAVNQSAANRGNLFSGATAKALARSTADIQAQQYDKAQQVAQQKYNNKYGEYMDRFDMTKQALQNNLQNQRYRTGDMGALVQQQTGAYGSQLNAQSDVRNAADTARTQQRAQELEAQAQKKGLQSPFMATVTGALGAVGSAMSQEK